MRSTERRDYIWQRQSQASKRRREQSTSYYLQTFLHSDVDSVCLLELSGREPGMSMVYVHPLATRSTGPTSDGTGGGRPGISSASRQQTRREQWHIEL